MKAIFGLLLLLASGSHSFANCLDVIPNNKKDLAKEIRRTKSELLTSEDMLKAYGELASDAQTKRHLKLAIGAVSTAPLFIAGALEVAGSTAGAIAAHESASMAYMAETCAFLPTVGDLRIMWGSIKGYMRNEKKELNIVQERYDFIEKYALYEQDVEHTSGPKCSYDRSFKAIEKVRLETMNKKLNGSIYNTFWDGIGFGKTSRDATLKLYVLENLKKSLLEKKLKALELYNEELI